MDSKSNLKFFNFVVFSVALFILPLTVFIMRSTTSVNSYAKGDLKGSQTIQLNKDWNIVSFNRIPTNMALADIVKPLVDNGSLIMVKDQLGNSLWPEYDIDTIGDMSLSEGYQVYMAEDAQLVVSGAMVPRPYIISLGSGWNIMGYPSNKPMDAKKVMASLIKDDSLVILEDENGNTLSKVDGKWINNIGKLRPGEGYKINVKVDTILAIN